LKESQEFCIVSLDPLIKLYSLYYVQELICCLLIFYVIHMCMCL